MRDKPREVMAACTQQKNGTKVKLGTLTGHRSQTKSIMTQEFGSESANKQCWNERMSHLHLWMRLTPLETVGSLSNDKMNNKAGASEKFNEDLTVNFNKISIKITEYYFGIYYCTCPVLNVGLTITLEQPNIEILMLYVYFYSN